MLEISWNLIFIVIALLGALFCDAIAALSLYVSITSIGWYEISWADKDRLKGDFWMYLIISLIFWSMLYILLKQEGYITVIAGYMPIAITDDGLRIGY